MAEETIQQEEVKDVVAPAVEAPAAEAPAETRKPEVRRDIFAELGLADDDDKIKILKAKGSKNVTTGIVHISSTFNNTIVSVTDLKGNVIGWSSAGKLNFKGISRINYLFTFINFISKFHSHYFSLP